MTHTEWNTSAPGLCWRRQ